jgi:hypothetical protein
VKSGNLVPYDPEAEGSAAAPVPESIREPALRNLYRHIVAVMAPLGIRVAPPVHQSYQEVYTFESKDGASCMLRLVYNKRLQVTKIETGSASPMEFADQVRHILTSGEFHFTDPLQRTLYMLFAERLKRNAISIESIEHYQHQDVYYLKAAGGELRLQVHYDGDGFVTRVAPTAYSVGAVLESVKDALAL